MKKLIVLSESDEYNPSGTIRYLIKMFYESNVIDMFKKRGLEIITSKYIKEKLNITEEDFINNIEKKEDCLILGIHPYGWKKSIKFGNGIKKIMWQDDLHYFSNFVDRNGQSVQEYSEKYEPIILNEVDFLITPSYQYFKNLNIVEYDDKIIDFFYFLNEKVFEEIENEFSNRIDGVVLSGAIYEGYKSRIEFEELKNSEEFDNLIHKITHPGYENNQHMTELNYYKELSKYKAPFVGHHNFPLNFLLAKHIEVLMCGCLGFFEPNPLLQEQLGLIEYVHYIPCFDESGLIKDKSFYINWIKSEDGEKIANNGKEYVRKKFGLERVEVFVDIISSL